MRDLNQAFITLTLALSQRAQVSAPSPLREKIGMRGVRDPHDNISFFDSAKFLKI
jgi:hypothetical protein